MGLFNFKIENSTLASRPWKNHYNYWASFELYPERKGNTYYVFRGAAFHQRDYFSQRMVVVKTPRKFHATASDWLTYKKRCDVGHRMAANFNKYLQSLQCHSKISFVEPTDAVMDSISDVMTLTRPIMRFNKHFSQDEAVLFEDLLEGEFKHFLTSKGLTTPQGDHVLDAFSHFTYHASAGDLVVCDLKGVENDDHNFTLTHPVIHSIAQAYGESDKALSGINEFFHNHVCSSLCKDFSKPVSNQAPMSVHHTNTIAGNAGPADNTRSDEITKSKECESWGFEPHSLDQYKPPEYASLDPNAPPPYTAD